MQHEMTALEINNYIGSEGFDTQVNDHLRERSAAGWELVSTSLHPSASVDGSFSTDVVMFWKK